MAECTRTRRIYRGVFGEILWSKQQIEQARRIQAEEEARIAREEAAANRYQFARYDDECFYDAQGKPVQMALLVTDSVEFHTGVVICKEIDGKPTWAVMKGYVGNPTHLIEVAQDRVAYNRAQRQ